MADGAGEIEKLWQRLGRSIPEIVHKRRGRRESPACGGALFVQHLEHACRRATRSGQAVAVLAFSFESYEEACRARAIVGEGLREGDVVSATSDNTTFAAIVNIVAASEVPEALSRILDLLASSGVPARSNGTAVFPDEHLTPADLILAAFDRLPGKSSGNRSSDNDFARVFAGSDATPARDTAGLRGREGMHDLLDRSFAVVLLVLASPIIAIAALLVRLTSPGPAFFVQRRTGLRGQSFPLVKLRTMDIDAEERLEEVRSLSEVDGHFKASCDPRVTQVGRILRKSSIDELPQLWNVARGEMSLVGPRPSSNPFDEHERWQIERLAVKPGITGLWQIRHRGDLSFRDRCRLDIRYVRAKSFMNDLQILLQTVPAVLFMRGRH